MAAAAAVILLLGLIVGSESAAPKNQYLGIPPHQDQFYYRSGDTFKCNGSKKTFTKAQLNDDFCDCLDGTDEPGTSACPLGKFYCRNAGHTPLSLFSSRVNDGICDCCDGSDEYDGQIECSNTCWEAGKVARNKLKAKIATYKEGITLRDNLVRKAKSALAKDEADLSSLKKDEAVLKPLVQQLKERKEQLDKAEEKERLRKEKEQKEAEEMDKKNPTETLGDVGTGKEQTKAENADNPLDTSHDDDQIGTLDDAPPYQTEAVPHLDLAHEAEHVDDSKIEAHTSHVAELGAVEEEKELASLLHKKDEPAGKPGVDHTTSSSEGSIDLSKVANDEGENTEGLSKEELGRLVASRWTGTSEKISEEVDSAKDSEHEYHEDSSHDDEEHDGYSSETDDDHGKYDDADAEDSTDDNYEDNYEEDTHHDAGQSYQHDLDENEQDFSDITSSSNPSWLEKIQQTVHNFIQAVNVFQAPVDRSDAAKIRKEYEESDSKLTKLQSKIASLTKKLKHDFGVDKEFYSFHDQCFEGKQNKYVYKVCPFKHASQQEGHSSTRLGRWDKFEDSYRVMVFSNGEKCWNGPDRSLKVKLRCGLKNEVTDVDEPSRCEYVALLSTPAVCLDQKLKELEEKLELMNKQGPQGHDEL